jgi:hypothetical protein
VERAQDPLVRSECGGHGAVPLPVAVDRRLKQRTVGFERTLDQLGAVNAAVGGVSAIPRPARRDVGISPWLADEERRGACSDGAGEALQQDSVGTPPHSPLHIRAYVLWGQLG